MILTVAAVASAFINFQQNFQADKKFKLADDGVTWVDRKDDAGKAYVLALTVAPASPAEKAGIHAGDTLYKIETVEIRRAIEVAQVLVRLGPWQPADYHLYRGGYDLKARVIVGEGGGVRGFLSVRRRRRLSANRLLVYFRRGNAPKSLHSLSCASPVSSCQRSITPGS